MVSAGNMYRHMVMALLTDHLSGVSNLHLILGNLLLVRLDVGPWPQAPSPWPLVPKSLLTSPWIYSVTQHINQTLVMSARYLSMMVGAMTSRAGKPRFLKQKIRFWGF